MTPPYIVDSALSDTGSSEYTDLIVQGSRSSNDNYCRLVLGGVVAFAFIIQPGFPAL
jgi:hypothetical protein